MERGVREKERVKPHGRNCTRKTLSQNHWLGKRRRWIPQGFFLLFFLRFIYFRVRESASGRRGRRRGIESRTGSPLNMKPVTGFDPRTLRSWPELKSRGRHLTDTLRHPQIPQVFREHRIWSFRGLYHHYDHAWQASWYASGEGRWSPRSGQHGLKNPWVIGKRLRVHFGGDGTASPRAREPAAPACCPVLYHWNKDNSSRQQTFMLAFSCTLPQTLNCYMVAQLISGTSRHWLQCSKTLTQRISMGPGHVDL